MSDQPYRTPVALTIAGSDPSGGAGIQADIKTFAAFRVHDASAITVITVQSTKGVEAVHPLPADQVAAQIEAVLADLDIRVVKIGMLGTRAIVEAVADALAALPSLIPIVLDPVLVSSSGASLLEVDALNALKTRLLPLARVITPNIAEAARLLDAEPAHDDAGVLEQAKLLARSGPKAALITGGDLAGADSVDVLYDRGGRGDREDMSWFRSPRIVSANTHGTGCTLAAAIAAALAHGQALGQAVGHAKAFVEQALRGAAHRSIGHGAGPLDPLFALGRGYGERAEGGQSGGDDETL